MTIKPGGYKLLALLGFILIAVLLLWDPFNWTGRGPVESRASSKVEALRVVNSPATSQNVVQLPLPSDQLSQKVADKPPVTLLVMGWNSQMGQMFANGGPQTTEGSLMEKYNVNLKLVNQNDVELMKSELLTFADRYANGEQYPTVGAPMCQIMGDGSFAFVASIWDQMQKYGDDYVPIWVGSVGMSYGEDGLYGPAKWKTKPQTMKGAVIAGYLRDGDWNIALNFMSNQTPPIKNNRDETTYDPEAVNWVSVPTYIDAAQRYINNYSEERDVVINGKRTGETKKITVQGVVTWTPGDVMIFENNNKNIVPIVTTREYSGQMPNALIVIKKWAYDNPQIVEGILSASFDGADQIRAYPEALELAGNISATVYNGQGELAEGSYWVKYFLGVDTVTDNGDEFRLGGSRVFNLADNKILFGQGLAKATFNVFAKVLKEQYPKLVPKAEPTADEVIDPSFINNLRPTKQIAADKPKYAAGTIKQTYGKRIYRITFETGSSQISSGQLRVLDDLKDQLAVARDLKVEINGYTDDVGDLEMNVLLSHDRAEAVETWLRNEAPELFDRARIVSKGFGENNPVADNTTSPGRALNRRVELVTGK
jgi:outer membrane protein OmpA-like peptidoglycan-associated protein